MGCSNNVEREYYPSGQLKRIGERIDGKKEGNWIDFNETGDTVLVTPFLHGEFHGQMREYENNKLKSIATYKNGVHHGFFQSFYPSGALFNEGMKENGYHVGEWVNYYETGEVESRSLMEDEKPSSTTNYYRNGNIQYTVSNFDNGIAQFFDSTGVKLYDVTVIKGQLTDTIKAR